MRGKKSNVLFCFSPPVMIATFAIETILFVYTIWRYRMNPLGRIIAATLACLAIFQFAEYHVCGLSMMPANWSRVGFVAITLLPALGIHLVHEIAGKRSRVIVGAAYASSIGFAAVLGFQKSAFEGHVCAGNYAVFQMGSHIGGAYFAYYYALLFAGILLSWKYSEHAKANVRKALKFQAIGYLSFMIPTGIVNALNPHTLEGLPSIMCGFAVTYALVLVFTIVPLVLTRKETASNKQMGHAS